jgi:hypothetical protein
LGYRANDEMFLCGMNIVVRGEALEGIQLLLEEESEMFGDTMASCDNMVCMVLSSCVISALALPPIISSLWRLSSLGSATTIFMIVLCSVALMWTMTGLQGKNGGDDSDAALDTPTYSRRDQNPKYAGSGILVGIDIMHNGTFFHAGVPDILASLNISSPLKAQNEMKKAIVVTRLFVLPSYLSGAALGFAVYRISVSGLIIDDIASSMGSLTIGVAYILMFVTATTQAALGNQVDLQSWTNSFAQV